MNINSVLYNLNINGLSGTAELFRLSQQKKKLQAELEKQIGPLVEALKDVNKQKKELENEEILNRSTDALELLSKYREVVDSRAVKAMQARKLLQSIEKKKGYKPFLKEYYLRTLIPAAYSEGIKSEVSNKVIFLENGDSPSTSCDYIGKQLEAEGKYEVVYWGCKLRQGAQAEYYQNALNFIREAATAKAVFLSTANGIMSCIEVRPETKVIQLWHGVGMFKKCGYSKEGLEAYEKGNKNREAFDQYRNYSYLTIAGQEQAWTFEEATRISADSGIIVPVGIAKTDVFYNNEYIEFSKKKLRYLFPASKGKKIILYAPTFRGGVKTADAPDQLDVRALANALGDEYVLVIKHHGLCQSTPELPKDLKGKFVYEVGAKSKIGIEELLAIADICITDYSSIAFDFAITERPIIFFAYDLDEYIDVRGMYYDYEEITPGPICKTNEEIIGFIKNIDTRWNKQAVIDFKNKYVDACDGHATERTIALIEK